MSNNRLKSGVMTMLLPGLLVGCGESPPPVAATKPEPASSYYVASATLQELMDSMVDPAANQLWNAVSFRADASGTHEIKPTTTEEWHQLRRAAIVIVESANLMAVPGRRVAVGSTTQAGADLDVSAIQKRVATRHEELMGFAAGMRDIGGKLVTAADQKNLAALDELGGELDTICEACHKSFWYPEQPPVDPQSK